MHTLLAAVDHLDGYASPNDQTVVAAARGLMRILGGSVEPGDRRLALIRDRVRALTVPDASESIAQLGGAYVVAQVLDMPHRTVHRWARRTRPCPQAVALLLRDLAEIAAEVHS